MIHVYDDDYDAPFSVTYSAIAASAVDNTGMAMSKRASARVCTALEIKSRPTLKHEKTGESMGRPFWVIQLSDDKLVHSCGSPAEEDSDKCPN